MNVFAYGKTDKGKKRKDNQDSILVDNALQLYCVADGIGGASSGDVASALAVSILGSYIRKLTESAFFQNTQQAEDIAVSLKNVFNKISQKIYDESQTPRSARKAEGRDPSMGTTLCVLLVCNNKVFIANTGDSRAYLLRYGKIWQLTDDHAIMLAGKSRLTHSIGLEPKAKCDVFVRELYDGDTFLLCSDGLYSMVSDTAIRENIYHDNNERTTERLIAMANDAGGEDNISTVVVSIRESNNKYLPPKPATTSGEDYLLRKKTGRSSFITGPFNSDDITAMLNDSELRSSCELIGQEKQNKREKSKWQRIKNTVLYKSWIRQQGLFRRIKESFIAMLLVPFVIFGLGIGYYYFKFNKDICSKLTQASQVFDCYYKQGVEKYEIKKYDSAKKNFNKAFAVWLNAENYDVEKLNKIGIINYLNKNETKALEIFSEITAKGSSNNNYKYNLARAYIATNNYKNAIENLNSILMIKREPKQAIVWASFLYKGLVEILNGQYIEAKNSLTSTINANPNFADSYIMYAYSAFKSGDQNEAIKFLKKALDLDPFYGRKIAYDQELIPLNIDENFLLDLVTSISKDKLVSAFILIENNKFEKAKQLLKTCSNEVAADKINAMLGIIEFEEGDLIAAEKMFNNALETNPSNITASLYMGKILLSYNKFRQASEFFSNALKLSTPGTNLDAYIFYGDLYLKMSNQAQAIELWKNVSNYDPYYRPAIERITYNLTTK